MRIKNSTEVSRTEGPQAPRDPSQKAIKDRVRKSSPKLEQAIQTAAAEAKLERQNELARVGQSVQSGSYRLDPHRVAEEILRSAELLARLQALLK